jgi:hypothetical protein
MYKNLVKKKCIKIIILYIYIRYLVLSEIIIFYETETYKVHSPSSDLKYRPNVSDKLIMKSLHSESRNDQPRILA